MAHSTKLQFKTKLATCSQLCLLGAWLILIAQAHDVSGKTSLKDFVGTWTGTSTCVGNRPACKNEIVVYRFVPVADNPKQLRQLADKIIGGKRVPMGAGVFELNERTGALEWEFKLGHTHGIWSYSVVADSMSATLIILPERSVGRDVKVHRVKDSEVPAAPMVKEYDE